MFCERPFVEFLTEGPQLSSLLIKYT